MNTSITTKYFKEYRKELGFTDQGDVESLFVGKDYE